MGSDAYVIGTFRLPEGNSELPVYYALFNLVNGNRFDAPVMVDAENPYQIEMGVFKVKGSKVLKKLFEGYADKWELEEKAALFPWQSI